MKEATEIYYRNNDEKAQVQSLRLFFRICFCISAGQVEISITYYG